MEFVWKGKAEHTPVGEGKDIYFFMFVCGGSGGVGAENKHQNKKSEKVILMELCWWLEVVYNISFPSSSEWLGYTSVPRTAFVH